MRILVIEDHERLASHVCKGLRAASFSVDSLGRGDEGLTALGLVRYDAVVLDLGLPDQDGLKVLRTLRSQGNSVPVLILTSRIQVSDRVKGLDAGADDYLTKPFAMEELVARIHALLRRPTDTLGKVLSAGNLTLDAGAREVRVQEAQLPLSKREMSLLEHLLRRTGKVVPKGLLEDSLFELSEGASVNAVEVLVHRLRKKLGDAGAAVSIHTVRGVGYILAPDQS